jgi:hypothetical protein
MGLTIHFRFNYVGDKDEVELKLKKIQDRIEHDLPHVKMFELATCDLSKGYDAVDPNYRWAAIQYSPYTKDEADPSTFIHFTISVDPGCESMNIGLVHDKGTCNWYGHAFCKTCYSNDFVKAHLSIVHALDICKQEGILASVSDEGDYYETRDMKHLTENVAEGNAMIAKLFMALKTAEITSGEQLTIQAPIEAMINEHKEN